MLTGNYLWTIALGLTYLYSQQLCTLIQTSKTVPDHKENQQNFDIKIFLQMAQDFA